MSAIHSNSAANSALVDARLNFHCDGCPECSNGAWLALVDIVLEELP